MNALQSVERTFQVWKLCNSVPTKVGIVKAANHTLADTKASRIFGRATWTTERD